MHRLIWRFSCVLLPVILLYCGHGAQAFDIAVYFDARSGVNYRCQVYDSSFCYWNEHVPRATAIGNIGPANEQQVFNWFSEMGVTHVIPYYPFADDFTADFWHNLHGIKILNSSYPAEAFKYLEAQNRDIIVRDANNQYVHSDNWKSPVADSTCGDSLVVQRRSALGDTMWQPQSDLGVWAGWNRREALLGWDVFMPMHFRITCNLVKNGNPPGYQQIASFLDGA
ncbi:MAG TPA: hypothetical protein VGL38_12065 [bacterium]